MQLKSLRIKSLSISVIVLIITLINVLSISAQTGKKDGSNPAFIRHLISLSLADSAINLLQNVYKPELPDKNILLAIAYQSLGQTDSVSFYVRRSFAQFKMEPNPDKKKLAEIYYILGWAKYKLSDIDSAGYFNLKALDLCNSLDLDSLKVFILKNLGNNSLAGGDIEGAEAYYNEALKIERAKNTPSVALLAGLIQNMGIIFASTGQLDSAKLYFARSLELKETISQSDIGSLANGYANFSNFLRSLGEPIEALKYINKAEKLLIENNSEDYRRLAPVYLIKGGVLIILNNFEEALTYHELAYTAYRQFLKPDDKTFVSLNYNIGNIHESLGNYSMAIKYHLDVIDKDLDPLQLVKTLRSLGSCYANIDQDSLAEVYFIRSVGSAESNLGKHNDQTALSYLKIGYFYTNLGYYDKAIDYYHRSLAVYESIYGEKNRDVSNVLSLIGFYYFNTKDYIRSLQFYQKSLNSFFEFYNDTNYCHNPTMDLDDLDFNVFIILYGKAFSFYGLYERNTRDIRDLEYCIQTINKAIEYYENFKNTLDAENTKLILATRVNNIYNLAVKTASELYYRTGEAKYIDLAFRYSEKSKSQVLLSSIRESDAIKEGLIPHDLKQNEEQIKTNIVTLDNLIYEEKQKSSQDSVKIAELQKDLYRQKIIYDSLIHSLEINYPVYFNLKFNHDVIDLKDVIKNLGPNQLIVEYKLADSLLYTFILGADTIALQRNTIDTSFIGKVEEFINMMKILPVSSGAEKSSYEYAQYGNEIYNVLFPGDYYESKELIIIPDDILGYLSFDALVTKLPDKATSSFRTLDYLIYKHPLFYGYSATLLFNKSKKGRPSRMLLAMAPTYKSSREVNLAHSNVRDIDQNLRPLFHTDKEVSQINETFSGKLLIGDEATEQNFKDIASKYKILHFAMHTLVNDENPFASQLVFSVGHDTIDDGLLNVYEIYNLDLNAELAVLSACKTGVGRLNRGEGVMSLARGFFYAGVPGIVMTLWAIEDGASMEIITGFYQNLNSGMKKDIALREAKLNYLNNADQMGSHPYFWAAYVQIGDNSELSTETNQYMIIEVVGGVVLLVLIILLIVRIRK
ncbi:MAG TPA: CHAT domain-containing protein [Bacteroidales bacterium]|nr:CHAT domain-containing protein [Bacteroidales bacterium]